MLVHMIPIGKMSCPRRECALEVAHAGSCENARGERLPVLAPPLRTTRGALDWDSDAPTAVYLPGGLDSTGGA